FDSAQRMCRLPPDIRDTPQRERVPKGKYQGKSKFKLRSGERQGFSASFWTRRAAWSERIELTVWTISKRSSGFVRYARAPALMARSRSRMKACDEKKRMGVAGVIARR